MKHLLEELGIRNAERHTNDLISFGERLISRCGIPVEECIVLDSPSLIGKNSKSPRPSSIYLVVDIGGSNTKFGFRYAASNGDCEWKGVHEYSNPSLDVKGEGAAHERFSRELFLKIKGHYWPDTLIDGLAIVWSNAVEAFKLEGRPSGVGGKVTARTTGYKKGEFFIEDLKDGDDLFKIFQRAAAKIGCNPPRVIIGNDTIFTATSVPGASGGMIASTGANATIWNGTSFGNSEMGVGIKLKPDWITRAERDSSPLRLEELMCGRTLPKYFLKNVAHLVSIGARSLEGPLSTLESMGDSFDAKMLAKILHGTFESSNADLIEVAKAHEERAASLGAIMGYLSLENQLGATQPLILALDSTLARNFPSFLSILQEKIGELSKRKISISLVMPDGHVSVPMKGAAAALDSI